MGGPKRSPAIAGLVAMTGHLGSWSRPECASPNLAYPASTASTATAPERAQVPAFTVEGRTPRDHNRSRNAHKPSRKMHYREAQLSEHRVVPCVTNHVFLFFKQHGHWRIDHHFDCGDAALGLRVQWT